MFKFIPHALTRAVLVIALVACICSVILAVYCHFRRRQRGISYQDGTALPGRRVVRNLHPLSVMCIRNVADSDRLQDRMGSVYGRPVSAMILQFISLQCTYLTVRRALTLLSRSRALSDGSHTSVVIETASQAFTNGAMPSTAAASPTPDPGKLRGSTSTAFMDFSDGRNECVSEASGRERRDTTGLSIGQPSRRVSGDGEGVQSSAAAPRAARKKESVASVLTLV